MPPLPSLLLLPFRLLSTLIIYSILTISDTRLIRISIAGIHLPVAARRMPRRYEAHRQTDLREVDEKEAETVPEWPPGPLTAVWKAFDLHRRHDSTILYFRGMCGGGPVAGILLRCSTAVKSRDWSKSRLVGSILLTMTIAATPVPLSEAKARLSELTRRVRQQHERITLTRNGEAEAVLLSVDDLEGLEMTLEILGDTDAVARISESLAALGRGEPGADMATVRQDLARRRVTGE
jgi:antitoxin YefM